MKKIALIYGVISGLVIIGTAILSLVLAGGDTKNMASLEWLGYLTMIVAFSVIFIGIKRYRDQELGGVIRFGTAFLVGLGISAVASVVYVATWEIYLASSGSDFIGQFTESAIAAVQESGASDAEIQKKISEMEWVRDNYSNPLFRIPLTLVEIFPVGLLVSLIAALVLRKSHVLPADERGMVSPAT